MRGQWHIMDLLLVKGWVRMRIKKEGARYVKKAADLNDPFGLAFYGIALSKGWDGEEDFTSALDYFSRASQRFDELEMKNPLRNLL